MNRVFSVSKTAACAVALAGMVLFAGCGGGGGESSGGAKEAKAGTKQSGGGSPKSLAKQGWDLTMEIQKLSAEGKKDGDAKYDAAMKKSAEFRKKLEQLSEDDMKIYMEEAGRLLQESNK